MLKCGTEIIDLVVLGRNYWSSCRVNVHEFFDLGFTGNVITVVQAEKRAKIDAATVCCLELGSLFWVSKIIISLH